MKILIKFRLLTEKLKLKKKSWLFILVVLFFLFLGGGLAALWYLPKVELVLQVKPHLIEKSFIVTLDGEATMADHEGLVLPAGQATALLREDSSIVTTGVKTVGDKATGQVTIFNRTATEKTIEAGTLLIGPDGLNFSLNEEVVIAAVAEGTNYEEIPGQAVVVVTAEKIGSESNLAGGTEFEVGKYSRTDVVARSQEAFDGGSSQQIQVVSQADLDQLKDNLLTRLKAQAEGELAAKQQSGEIMIPESIEFEIEEETYQPGLDEETELVTASLGVRFAALTYQIQSMDELVKEKVASSVPDGYRYQDDRKEIDFELEEVVDNQATFRVKVWANLLPAISLEQIQNDLRGKTMMAASVYLGSLGNGVVGYLGPNYWPGLIPERLRRFPQQAERIQIEISAD